VDGAICVVDVEDVAAGLLLCDESGAAGERYILGTRNYTWKRLFAELEQLSGVEGPAVRLPVPAALPTALTSESGQSGIRPSTMAYFGSINEPMAPEKRMVSSSGVSGRGVTDGVLQSRQVSSVTIG
jgi:nucleoside-diphosphate-sugar epimerase